MSPTCPSFKDVMFRQLLNYPNIPGHLLETKISKMQNLVKPTRKTVGLNTQPAMVVVETGGGGRGRGGRGRGRDYQNNRQEEAKEE
jgi:hypothetical protein